MHIPMSMSPIKNNAHHVVVTAKLAGSVCGMGILGGRDQRERVVVLWEMLVVPMGRTIDIDRIGRVFSLKNRRTNSYKGSSNDHTNKRWKWGFVFLENVNWYLSGMAPLITIYFTFPPWRCVSTRWWSFGNSLWNSPCILGGNSLCS